MPVVRNQTFVYVMDWLRLASSENGVNSNVFPLVKDVIIAGITDIWSAIRNTCVAKLSKFLELFTLPQVEEFYGSLVKVGANTSNFVFTYKVHVHVTYTDTCIVEPRLNSHLRGNGKAFIRNKHKAW